MKPQRTTYRLINEKTAPEVPAIEYLWKKHKIGPIKPLGFPTIVAEREKRIIGFLSSRPSKEMVAAGPLVVDVEGNRAFVAMRLVDFYEKVLVSAGVTLYTFRVSKTAPKSWLNTIDEMLCRPYNETDKAVSYTRYIEG